MSFVYTLYAKHSYSCTVNCVTHHLHSYKSLLTISVQAQKCPVCGHRGKGKTYLLVAKTTAPSCATLHFESFDQRHEAQAFKSLWALARIVRNRVFVEEGRIAAELEFDVNDRSSRHVLGLVGDAPVLCARWRVEFGEGGSGGGQQQGKGSGGGCSIAVIDRLAVLEPYRGRGFSSHTLKFLLEDVDCMAREMQPQGWTIGAVAVTLPEKMLPFWGEKLRSQGGFEVVGGSYTDERNQLMLRMVRLMS